MAETFTPNYNLGKPDGGPAGDFVDVGVLNLNSDLIDAALTSQQSQIDNLDAAITPIYVEKAVDQPLSGTTVFTDDTEIFLNLEANTIYELRYVFLFDKPTGAGGIKIQVVGPIGSTGGPVTALTMAATPFVTDDIVPGTHPQDDSATRLYSDLLRIKTTGAGVLKLQFAQDTVHATPIVSKAGSFMYARIIKAA